MEKLYESKYHKLEDNHWWFVARRDVTLRLIRKLNLPNTAKILEIGCSGGPLIDFLKHHGFTNIYGIDISKDAIDLCKKRNIHTVTVMDGAKTQFENEEFDIVIASDILEHIENDHSALTEWYRLLKPNGALLLFVPAFDFLWSNHDEANRHYRRYNKQSLTQKLGKAQFKFYKIFYWNFVLFFPTYVVRTFQRFFCKKNEAKDQLCKLSPLTNGLLIMLLKTENFFIRYFNFPIGVSIFTIGRKSN